MRLLGTALAFVLVVSGTIRAQDQSTRRETETPESESISLEGLLRNHESQISRLKTADVSWSVAFKAPGRETTTEEFRTILAPDFYAETSWRQGGRPSFCFWDGERFGRIMGFSPQEDHPDEQASLRARAFQFNADLPIKRLLHWRTLRSYRLYANDADLWLRDLCERSPTKPAMTKQGNLIRLAIGHPGVAPQESSGLAGVPRGVPIQIDLDPDHGFLVKRHQTTFKSGNDDVEVTQILEVVEFESVAFENDADELFLPRKVKYSVAASDGAWEMEQDIHFEYSNVNEPIDTSHLTFAPHMVVAEFQQYGDAKPTGFYVVSKDSKLGVRYSSEVIANTVQAHSRGLIDKAELESRLAIQSNVPDVGALAPKIVGTSVKSGANEEFGFEGKVTAIEFWSTTCGPCQHAMDKFDELAAATEKKWPGKVQFVTVSLDEDHESVQQRMKERAWTHTQSLIDSRLADGPSVRATYPYALARKYVVTGVPTCLIVDQEGRIAFRGNLFDEELGATIETLLSKKD